MAADLTAYQGVRFAALADHPEAFASSWQEEMRFDEATLLQRILPPPPSVALGGFSADMLVGIAGLYVQPRPKQCHKGMVVGVYVVPDHRRTGLACGLLAALIDGARKSGLVLLQLSVSVGNEPARRLYGSLGFRPYGIERRALQLADRFVDEELMALDLD